MQGGSRRAYEERIRTKEEEEEEEEEEEGGGGGESTLCKNNKREDGECSSSCSLQLQQFMLSQARLPSRFFVGAAKIVTYLSRTAAGFLLLLSVSFQRSDLKECASGRGRGRKHLRVTIAHCIGVIGKNLISTPTNQNRGS